ncbi:hypothetical protein GAYE_SCF56G6383 [Galdieria yellowstonensis]|uniref:Uncharacterized protein n=1 Tax=Galdieria yellowstonensis TaxID=3028027 RepID=A0AAV9ILZ3_9RHOD|nr:hypothetical protein GAYE_SCF56G6383 [Galdieria yellowstonensis]
MRAAAEDPPQEDNDESRRLAFCIEAKRRGDAVSYFRFLEQLGSSQGELLSAKIQAVTKNAAKKHPELEELILHCLDFDWEANATSHVALNAFTNFVLTVTSLHVNYVEPVIASLTKNIVCKDYSQVTQLEEQAVKEEVDASGTKIIPQSGSLLSRILQLLQLVVDGYPTSSRLVYNSIHSNAPHKLRSLADQRIFIYGALLLSKTFRDIRQAVVFLVVEKLIEVDAEASQILKKEKYSPVSDSMAEEELETKEIADMVNKMDKLMEQVLLFIRQLDNSSEVQSFRSYFMNAFIRLVLPLLHLRFTPFLFCILYGSSMEETQELLWRLWSIFTDGKNYEETRIFSVKYCSFMLSSLRVVRYEMVVRWLSMAVSWLHEYLELHENNCCHIFQEEEEDNDMLVSGSWKSEGSEWLTEDNMLVDPLNPSKRLNVYAMDCKHRIFYHTLDAVFYVMLSRGNSLLSFEYNRGKDSLQRGNLVEKFRSFRLARILRSSLCPLLFLPREHSRKFIYWAFSLRLFDCRDLLEMTSDETMSDIFIEKESYVSMIPLDMLESCSKWSLEILRKPDDLYFSEDE